MTTHRAGRAQPRLLVKRWRVVCHSIGLFLPLLRMLASDPFAENVRPTEPLAPEQQQKTFPLPPGFVVQLVAAEPDINKPMNLAFDATGRLWATTSREYPPPGALATPAPP